MKNKQVTFAVAIAAIIIIGGVIAAGSTKKAATPSASASTSNSSTTVPSGAVATNTVKIENYMFTPMVTTVKVGDTMTWTNMDSVHHNVITDNKSPDGPNGPLLGQGESYSFKFTKAGTYSFHCGPHPYMHGTVVVTN